MTGRSENPENTANRRARLGRHCPWKSRDRHGVLPLALGELGFLGRLVGHAQVRRLQALVVLHLRRQAAFQNAADQQRAVHRIGRNAGLKHSSTLCIRHAE